MIKAARKVKVFASDTGLCQVARNALVDHVRKQARYCGASMDLLTPFVNVPETAPERDLLNWLDQGLAALGSEDRELLERVYFQGCPQKELAVVNGTSLKSIKSRLARIRKRLRQFTALAVPTILRPWLT